MAVIWRRLAAFGSGVWLPCIRAPDVCGTLLFGLSTWQMMFLKEAFVGAHEHTVYGRTLQLPWAGVFANIG